MAGHVLIAGAGPAGALLGYLLARGGVRVTLIERHGDFSREFRGEGMSPSGMAAIRAAGLWEDFEALPATALESMSLYAEGRAFLDLDIDRMLPRDMNFIRVMGQEHLLEMLVAKSEQFPNFTLLRETVVRDVLRDGDRVTGLRVGAGGEERDIRADYVVAADGRFSLLRKRCGLDLDGRTQVFDVVWCKIPRPSIVPRGRVYSFLLGQFFGLVFPTEGDRLQVGLIIPKGTYREFRDPSEGDWYAHVLEMLPPELREGFAAQRGQASDPALLDVVCGALAHWSTPGLMFIGDAAHPMSPVGAQGINIALRDALVAANYLGPVLLAGASGAAVDKAAAAFEAERRPEVAKIQQQQTQAPAAFDRMKRVAPLLHAIPKGWLERLARLVLGLRATRSMIEGTTKLTSTFGAGS